MKTERCASTGPPARRATPRLALIALALAAIGLEGCQSIQSINPFRNCAGCGPLSRIGNGNGLFNRNRGRVVYDEPPIIVDPAPGVEVLPGAPAIIDTAPPMGSTLVPADPALTTPPTTVRPPDDALELEPLPEPSGRAPQNPGSPRAAADRSLGGRPIDRTSGGLSASPSTGDPYADRMARRSSDVSPARPAPEPAHGPGRAEFVPAPSESLRVIDRLPAPEAIAIGPHEDSAPPPPAIGGQGAAAPAAPAAAPAAEPAAAGAAPAPAEPTPPAVEPPPIPTPEPSPPPAPEPSPPPVAEPPPPPAEPMPTPSEPTPPAVSEPAPAAPAEAAPPPPEPPAVSDPNPAVPESQPEVGSASGTGSFYSVAPLLAGGAIPDEAGWALLAERGYRTVLDLRPVDQVRPADFASSSRLGLRHVLLPTTPGTIDAALVARFEEELAVDSARPIFFCDADGSTAAALWFVHRVSVDLADPERARRDAERIAPIPPALMLAARAYLDRQSVSSRSPTDLPPLLAEVAPSAADAPDRAPDAPASTPDHDPATAPEVADASPSTPIAEGAAPAAGATTPAEGSIAEVFADPFAKPSPVDPKGWGPYAAFFLTILVVPLAYWSSTNLSAGLRSRARASLAAPERRPRSLPAGSDAGT